MEDPNKKFYNLTYTEYYRAQHRKVGESHGVSASYVRRILDLFGKKYVKPIIKELLIGKKLRFNEIKAKKTQNLWCLKGNT